MLGRILNTFGTRFMSAVFQLLIAIIISNVLGPEGKGQQGLILATTAYIIVFANLMGGGAIIYLVPRFSYYLIMIPAYVWAVLTSAVAFVVLQYSELVDQQFMIHVCLLALINTFTYVNSTILVGKEKIKTSNLVAFIQPLITGLSLLLFYFILDQKSIDYYIIALYISFGISFFVSLFYLFRIAETFRFTRITNYTEVTKQLVRYGILNQLAHIFQLFSFRVSYYFLQSIYSEAEVGIYSNGTSIVESIWLISRSISLVQYARIANTDDRKYSQKLTVSLSKASIMISIVLLTILIILPSGFWVFIFGEGFGAVGQVIRSLAPGVLFFNLALIVGHYFSGTGQYHVNTISSFAGMIISLILFYIMIPVYGIIGAGLATSISYTLTSCVVMLYFYRQSDLRPGDFMPVMKDFIEFRQMIRDTLKRS